MRDAFKQPHIRWSLQECEAVAGGRREYCLVAQSPRAFQRSAKVRVTFGRPLGANAPAPLIQVSVHTLDGSIRSVAIGTRHPLAHARAFAELSRRAKPRLQNLDGSPR